MTRKPYPGDLTDAEWMILEPLLPPEKSVGSEREVDLPEVINALMYVADNGIKWRAMPDDSPAWQTVYGYLRRWSQSGLWEEMMVALARKVRLAKISFQNLGAGWLSGHSPGWKMHDAWVGTTKGYRSIMKALSTSR